MARSQPNAQSDDAQRPRIARGELALLLVIALAGAGLRFAYPSRLAIEHFDEGVYASNIWFGEAEGFRYPARHLYAPPLFPSLVEWSIILFGLGPLSVKLVSLLAGTVTVPLVWWTARRWFGAEAGMAAAALAACSDFHVLFSRMALTDALLCLWLLAAVYCVHEMYARGRHRWALAAGLATGLAWSTKYNGWLPLAIAPAGLLFYRLVARWKSKASGATTRQHPLPWRSSLVSLAAMSATALVVWSPAWFDLSGRGGYAAVADNHRGYLVGLAGWGPSLLRQVANHRYLDGWLSCASLGLAALAAVIVCRLAPRGFTWNESRIAAGLMTAAGLLLVASAALLGSSVTIGLLAVGGIGLHLWRRPHDASALPACLLAVWLVGLSAATPFYSPYPRLTLPWLVAAWLGAGAMIGWLARWIARGDATAATTGASRTNLRSVPSSPGHPDAAGRPDVQPATRLQRHHMPILVGSAALFAAAMLFSAGRLTARGIAGWQPQTGLRNVAPSIVGHATRSAAALGSSPEGVILVYGEPGLFFHLAAEISRSDSPLVAAPASSVAPPRPVRVATFLVTGPNAERDPRFHAVMAQHRSRLELLARYDYRPGDLVLLNLHSPKELRDAGPPRQKVRLYRVDP